MGKFSTASLILVLIRTKESARSTTISFGKLQSNSTTTKGYESVPQSEEGRIAPTQRMSQIKGLFDD